MTQAQVDQQKNFLPKLPSTRKVTQTELDSEKVMKFWKRYLTSVEEEEEMAEAQVYDQKQFLPKLPSINKATQTELGSEKVFLLESNKIIKLYYSNVYKENVLAFCISNSKSFLINKKTWLKFRQLIPIIEESFNI